MGYSHKLFLGVALALLVSACSDMHSSSNASSVSPSSGPALAAPDVVTLRLAEAAERAAMALDNIAQVEQAQKGVPPADDYSMAPPELLEPVTITWTGPAELFVRAMANRAGYAFSTSGAPPPVPLTVRIDEYQQPLIKLVKSAALQVTGKADIVLNASNHTIELRYAPTQGY